MAQHTDGPFESPWQAPWWGQSVRTTSDDYAHVAAAAATAGMRNPAPAPVPTPAAAAAEPEPELEPPRPRARPQPQARTILWPVVHESGRFLDCRMNVVEITIYEWSDEAAKDPYSYFST
ncbi:hypothetical protein PG985_007534 [Apiospora marii]|uniref:Uncharacterized protein n=1 Tax=Apiospora marii TaxID=335849 RepID=A0ABR1SQ20_9PEZI